MILTKEKRFLPKNAVKEVDVGNYPELAVKKIYNEFTDRPDTKPYMPPKINKGRQLDKEYFWNVVNSLYEDELGAILDHANQQRNGLDDGEMLAESITCDRQMYDLMKKYPWKSVSTFSALALIFVL